MENSKSKCNCSSCGHEMHVFKDGVQSRELGLYIHVTEKNPQYEAIKESFGETLFVLCTMCFIESIFFYNTKPDKKQKDKKKKKSKKKVVSKGSAWTSSVT